MFGCMYIYVLNMCLCLQRPEREGIGYPVTRVTDGCEIPGGYWGSKLGTWKEQPLLLFAPSLQALKKLNLKRLT